MARIASELAHAGPVCIFILVTVMLGGGTAFMTGRAIAGTWRPWWHVALYMLVLGTAVRFLHSALFGASLLSPADYIRDTAVCLVFGFWGFRATRARQMAQQYGWIYRRAGPLSWARQSTEPIAAAPESD